MGTGLRVDACLDDVNTGLSLSLMRSYSIVHRDERERESTIKGKGHQTNEIKAFGK